jgi:hypothetical protein
MLQATPFGVVLLFGHDCPGASTDQRKRVAHNFAGEQKVMKRMSYESCRRTRRSADAQSKQLAAAQKSAAQKQAAEEMLCNHRDGMITF